MAMRGDVRAKADAWRLLLQDVESDPEAAQQRVAELHTLVEQHNAAAADAHVCCAAPFLRCCLRAKKYELPKALRLAINYDAYRRRCSWPTGSISVSELRPELESGFNLVLPKSDAFGGDGSCPRCVSNAKGSTAHSGRTTNQQQDIATKTSHMYL